MSRIILFLTIITVTAFTSTIKVAAASNIAYAIKDLVKEFNKQHPDIKVEFILGSSGKLTTQINHGANYDLFMSADMKYPKALYKSGIAITKPVVYASGSLVVLSGKGVDFSKGIKILLDPDIKKIAIANPKTAPYGKAAKDALVNAKIYNECKNKFVYGESVSHTLVYAIKATDLGVVAKSSLYSNKLKNLKEHKNWIDVDKSLYKPIEQGMVILKSSKDIDDAKAFYNFMLSQKAKAILEKYGYII